MAAQSGRADGFSIDPGLITVPALEPGLYVVATPIGNLADMTIRALATLARADIIACEDTRVTSTLTSRFGINTPFMPYHEHNAARMRPRLLSLLEAGQKIALVSDAGTPLVSDPGLKLVRAAIEAGHRVVPVPGASSLLAGLAGAGLPTDTVLFAGFLPPKSAGRRARMTELASVPATLVFFETAPRLAESLSDAAEVLGPARGAVVARELTKKFEEFRRGSLADLAGDIAEAPVKGEIVLLVGPPAAAMAGDVEVDRLLLKALEALPASRAAALVADATGRPRQEVYRRAMSLKPPPGGEPAALIEDRTEQDP